MRSRRIGTRHHRLASPTLTSPQTPAADHRRMEQSSVDSVTMRAISCDCGQTTAQRYCQVLQRRCVSLVWKWERCCACG